jgi:hypothetical protein
MATEVTELDSQRQKRWEEQQAEVARHHAELAVYNQAIIDQHGGQDPPPGYSYTPSGRLYKHKDDQDAKPKYVWPDNALFHFQASDLFILDQPAVVECGWGKGDQVLWADGEALIIAGVQGTGKTTLAQQLVLGYIGIPGYQDLLGFPITRGATVLYLAMDRPRQVARSFARMVDATHREQLNDGLVIWEGPPPNDLARNPELLLQMCQACSADLVVIDSLKDAAIGLSDDAVGAAYNRARQMVLRDWTGVVELHHLRKNPITKRHEPIGLDDLYGSTWLTTGAGSVILLEGKAGDPVVTMRHLKSPVSEVGPFQVVHNADRGRSEIWHEIDLVALARASRTGTITAADAAKALYGTVKPSQSDKIKVRRKLDRLVVSGHLWVFDQGDQATNRPTTWAAK